MPENPELTGLEPATPAVTGRCSNQLSYSSKNGSEIVMGSCKLGKCFINVNVVEIAAVGRVLSG